jgi:hypothetical protein
MDQDGAQMQNFVSKEMNRHVLKWELLNNVNYYKIVNTQVPESEFSIKH